MNFDSSVLNIPIEDIIPNHNQPRLGFSDDALNELCESIKAHGIIQPLVLRPNGEKYEIVAGERRYRAAKMAGLASVPAVIARINSQKSAEIAIAENIQRRPLTAIEEARSYKALLEKGYMNQEELARRMGLPKESITNKLRLLNLADEVQQAVIDNRISERHARSLLVIRDKFEQKDWLNKIIDERLTVRQLDEQLSEKYTDIPEENMSIPVHATEKKDIKNFADETANMDVFENNDDMELLNNQMFTLPPSKPSLPVEEIESLDFLPPGIDPIGEYARELENVATNINKEIPTTYDKMDNGNELVITIKIKK